MAFFFGEMDIWLCGELVIWLIGYLSDSLCRLLSDVGCQMSDVFFISDFRFQIFDFRFLNLSDVFFPHSSLLTPHFINSSIPTQLVALRTLSLSTSLNHIRHIRTYKICIFVRQPVPTIVGIGCQMSDVGLYYFSKQRSPSDPDDNRDCTEAHFVAFHFQLFLHNLRTFHFVAFHFQLIYFCQRPNIQQLNTFKMNAVNAIFIIFNYKKSFN